MKLFGFIILVASTLAVSAHAELQGTAVRSPGFANLNGFSNSQGFHTGGSLIAVPRQPRVTNVYNNYYNTQPYYGHRYPNFYNPWRDYYRSYNRYLGAYQNYINRYWYPRYGYGYGFPGYGYGGYGYRPYSATRVGVAVGGFGFSFSDVRF